MPTKGKQRSTRAKKPTTFGTKLLTLQVQIPSGDQFSRTFSETDNPRGYYQAADVAPKPALQQANFGQLSLGGAKVRFDPSLPESELENLGYRINPRNQSIDLRSDRAYTRDGADAFVPVQSFWPPESRRMTELVEAFRAPTGEPTVVALSKPDNEGLRYLARFTITKDGIDESPLTTLRSGEDAAARMKAERDPSGQQSVPEVTRLQAKIDKIAKELSRFQSIRGVDSNGMPYVTFRRFGVTARVDLYSQNSDAVTINGREGALRLELEDYGRAKEALDRAARTQ